MNNLSEKKPMVILTGPTAVGKTSLSIKLAKQINGAIISADSMQVYRHMDIGSAKIMPDEMHGIRHYLIDEFEPDEEFHVVKFAEKAKEYLNEIYNEGKIPIIVGGTGFYVQALLGDRPLADVDDITDEAFVEKWTTIAHEQGESVVRDALRELDPVSEARILPGQIRRLVRALLVSDHTGKPFSEQQPEPKRLYDAYIIGLTTDRPVLYERINTRVDAMIANGLLEEAQIAATLPEDSTAKKAIGYKELFGYLEGVETLEQASENLKQASRRYAKRQMTWFNNQFTDIHWYDLVQNAAELNTIEAAVQNFVSE